MITVTANISLSEDEISYQFIRSPGPGGQNVNKVESGVQIRFSAKSCPALNEAVFQRLKKIAGSRMTMDGVIILTATRYRSQIRNKEDGVERLVELIKKAAFTPKKRRVTRPTRASKQRRLDSKKRQGSLKKLRSKAMD